MTAAQPDSTSAGEGQLCTLLPWHTKDWVLGQSPQSAFPLNDSNVEDKTILTLSKPIQKEIIWGLKDSSVDQSARDLYQILINMVS